MHAIDFRREGYVDRLGLLEQTPLSDLPHKPDRPPPLTDLEVVCALGHDDVRDLPSPCHPACDEVEEHVATVQDEERGRVEFPAEAARASKSTSARVRH
jgi:hypothetical protein